MSWSFRVEAPDHHALVADLTARADSTQAPPGLLATIGTVAKGISIPAGALIVAETFGHHDTAFGQGAYKIFTVTPKT